MKRKSSIIFIIFIIFIMFITPAQALAATLSLSPSTGTFNQGCSFSLDIILDTGGVQTDGTDAYLKYDTSRISAQSVTKGTIYEDYPGTSIDDTAGKVAVSGLASVTQAFSGKGTLATINFTVKPTATVGATQITFDFNPNDKENTTDSNVVERGTVADVLSSVVNGSYTVASGGNCVSASPGPKVSPSPGAKGAVGPGGTATPSATPRTLDNQVGSQTGATELTYTFAIVGSILTILGILGLALL